MEFRTTILGTSSATPTPKRHPSAQLVQADEHSFLMDAGEGTQTQLARFKLKPGRISHIFISHLHPDHYLGLIGLVCTYNLQGRKKPLTIYGPPGLEEIVMVNVKHSGMTVNYDLSFVALEMGTQEVILDLPELTVETIPLEHRIPNNGFIFRQKTRKRKINQEAFVEAKLPHQAYPVFQRAEDFVDEGGKRWEYEDFTFEPLPSLTFACMSDTRYLPRLVPHIKGADLLYHEATFSANAEERAEKTNHTTTKQAATLARDAKVGKLIISHFSARYDNLEPLLEEAREVFPETYLAEEGKTFDVER